MAKRFISRLKELKERMPSWYEAHNDRNENGSGFFSKRLASDLLFQANVQLINDKDVNIFKDFAERAAKLQMDVHKRYDQGWPIEPFVISMKNFSVFAHLLASGNMSLVEEFSRTFAGRPEIEEQDETVESFWTYMSYTVKMIIEGYLIEPHPKSGIPLMIYTGSSAREIQSYPYHVLLTRWCRNNFPNLEGFGIVIEGLVNKEKAEIQRGFDHIAEYYILEAQKEDGFFGENVCFEPHMNVLGTALVNLARYKGYNPKINDELIPEELLISVDSVKC